MVIPNWSAHPGLCALYDLCRFIHQHRHRPEFLVIWWMNFIPIKTLHLIPVSPSTFFFLNCCFSIYCYSKIDFNPLIFFKSWVIMPRHYFLGQELVCFAKTLLNQCLLFLLFKILIIMLVHDATSYHCILVMIIFLGCVCLSH